jgi:hypothetical protein
MKIISYVSLCVLFLHAQLIYSASPFMSEPSRVCKARAALIAANVQWYRVPHGSAYALTFTDDGELIVAVGSGKGKLYCVLPGRENTAWELKGHMRQIASLAFSDDHTTLVSGSESATLLAHRIDQEKKHRHFLGHALHGTRINCVALSDDNRYVASASDEQVLIHLYDNHKVYQILTGHDAPVSSIAFSKNPSAKGFWNGSSNNQTYEPLIASGSTSHILVHRAREQTPRAAFETDGNPITSLLFAGDNQTIVSVSPRFVILHDALSLKPRYTLYSYNPDDNFVSAALSCDGLLLTVAGTSCLHVIDKQSMHTHIAADDFPTLGTYLVDHPIACAIDTSGTIMAVCSSSGIVARYHIPNLEQLDDLQMYMLCKAIEAIEQEEPFSFVEIALSCADKVAPQDRETFISDPLGWFNVRTLDMIRTLEHVHNASLRG